MAYKNGSITILILLVMAASTLIILIALKSAIACYELALERTEHIRQEKALEALLFYGIALAYESKDQTEYTFTCDQWPLPKGIYQGILYQKNSIMQVQLIQNNAIIMARTYIVDHDLTAIDGHV